MVHSRSVKKGCGWYLNVYFNDFYEGNEVCVCAVYANGETLEACAAKLLAQLPRKRALKAWAKQR